MHRPIGPSSAAAQRVLEHVFCPFLGAQIRSGIPQQSLAGEEVAYQRRPQTTLDHQCAQPPRQIQECVMNLF